jgi:hypothetical protein
VFVLAFEHEMKVLRENSSPVMSLVSRGLHISLNGLMIEGSTNVLRVYLIMDGMTAHPTALFGEKL